MTGIEPNPRPTVPITGEFLIGLGLGVAAGLSAWLLIVGAITVASQKFGISVHGKPIGAGLGHSTAFAVICGALGGAAGIALWLI